MASSVSTSHLLDCMSLQIWDHDPGTTNACLASPDGGTTIRYVDLRDYDRFAAAVAAAALTGAGPTKVEIVASDTITFGNVVVIKDSGTIVLNALAEWYVLECSAEEVQHLATTYNLRYVAARITCANAADEATVVYLACARRPHRAVTAAENLL